ncbi:hypothetical protein NDU88_006765 [Pleurodeles waltl]|uniref:Uncharacterized protein n=1 Tax=Pleurodeles waltl TaxID=8319 RepID=A0AAV7N2A9_PLEWA|nr:hypothetical protein NDU88_006765 [Pleurodeles waltl]
MGRASSALPSPVKSCRDPEAPRGWESRVPGSGGHLEVMGVSGTRFRALTVLSRQRCLRGPAGPRWSGVG